MIWWLALALGSSELAVEQGYVELDRGLPQEAMERARQGAATDPQLARLYLDAAAARGLGRRAVAETRGLSMEVPWDRVADGLSAMVKAQDDVGVKAEVERIVATWPTHPELLVGLWDPAATKKTQRLREAAVAKVVDEPVARARLLRMLGTVGQPVDALRAEVVAAIDPDPVWPSVTDLELHEIARRFMEKGEPIPDLALAQRREVIRRAHAMFLAAGRGAEAAELWRTDRPRVLARAMEAEALADAGDLPGAMAALEAGAALLGAPSAEDATGADPDRIAADAVVLLGQRSRIAEGERPAQAWVDAVVASCLQGEAIRTKATPAAAATLERAYPGADPVAAALAAAEKATVAADLERHVVAALAMVAARKDRLSSAVADSASTLEVMGEIWRKGAPLAARLGSPGLASEWGALAIAAGRADADLYLALAGMRAPNERDAAFHALAMARGLGGAVDEAALRAAFQGLGDAVEVATAVGGAPPPPPAPSDPIRVGARKGAAPRSAPPPPGAGAKLESKVPAWQITGPGGTVSSSSLAGRMVILSFFRSDYGPSVEQLADLGGLARRYRARGYDVVHVAISADDDPAMFDDLYRVGQRWGELALAPEVHATFGVRRVPTTWVIDREGVARYFVDHRVSPTELAAVLERIAIE